MLGNDWVTTNRTWMWRNSNGKIWKYHDMWFWLNHNDVIRMSLARTVQSWITLPPGALGEFLWIAAVLLNEEFSVQSRRHFASPHTRWDVSFFTPVFKFLDTIVTYTSLARHTLCYPPVPSETRDQQWTLTRRLLRFGDPSWLAFSQVNNCGNHWE